MALTPTTRVMGFGKPRPCAGPSSSTVKEVPINCFHFGPLNTTTAFTE